MDPSRDMFLGESSRSTSKEEQRVTGDMNRSLLCKISGSTGVMHLFRITAGAPWIVQQHVRISMSVTLSGLIEAPDFLPSAGLKKSSQ